MASETQRLLDRTGWRILRELRMNARLPMSEIGRRVNLSAPAVAGRIRRMEEAGVITGYHAAIDGAKVGRPITAFVHLQEAAGTDARVVSVVESSPEVVECHTVTGTEGFLIKISVASVEDLERFIERLVPLGRPRTSLVLSSPVDAAGANRREPGGPRSV